MQYLPSLFSDYSDHLEKPDQHKIQNSLDYLSQYFSDIKNDMEFLGGNRYQQEDFSQNSLKRVVAKKCIFEECSFDRVAGTGSLWSESIFINCEISNANFESSDFSGSSFISKKNKRTQLIGTNFSSSNFSSSNFFDIEILGASFSNVNFTKAVIKQCNIRSSTFENAIFDNCELTDLQLSNLNFEYADVNKTKFDNVEFSFIQFPYIIGIKKNDIDDGHIKITANNEILDLKKLNVIVQHLVTYFSFKNNYFPLLNLILIFELDQSMFKKYMFYATKYSIETGDYRVLKYLAKLIFLSNFYNSDEKKNLFDLIESKQHKSNIYYQSYLKHKSEIEYFLLPDSNKDSLILEFKSMANFSFQILSEIILCYEKANLSLNIHTLNFSENSPVKLKIFLERNQTEISFLLQFTAVLFAGISAYHSQFPKETQELNNSQKELAITVHNEIIQNIHIENLLVRNNSDNLLMYNVDHSPLYVNRENIYKIINK